MLIPAIGTQNNRTNFGAMFEPQNVNWNKAQKTVVDAIKKVMRSPSEKLNGQTPESFYKKKNGLDFGFSPHSEDSVCLTGYKGVKKLHGEEGYTNSESIYIGEYRQASSFDISDIDHGIKEHRRSTLSFAAICAAFVLAAVAIAKFGGGSAKIGHTKQSIENVVDLTDTAETVLNDTAKVMNPFKK